MIATQVYFSKEVRLLLQKKFRGIREALSNICPHNTSSLQQPHLLVTEPCLTSDAMYLQAQVSTQNIEHAAGLAHCWQGSAEFT